MKDVFLTSDFK